MWPFTRKKKPSRQRMYEGAAYNRLVSEWISQSTSHDTEIKASLVSLRNRTRQLARDSDYVKNAIREIQNNVVGQGIGFQSQIRMQRGSNLNETLNDKVEWSWYRWCKEDSCDAAGKLSFQDIERLIISALVTDGEFLIRKVPQRFGRSKVPFALELIEADYLDDEYNDVLDNGHAVRMGVELNEWGRPTAYYLRTKHPGDYSFSSVRRERSGGRIRVPANEIIHIFVTERAKQTRGVPWFASTLMRLRHMNGYEEAEVVAARAAASLMGFIETPEGEVQGDAVVDGDRVTQFEPGVFKNLPPGAKVNVPQISRPGGQFDPFMRIMLRGVAAGIGMSYESVSKDYSQTNYSSARQSLLPERDNWRIIQKWLVRKFHEKIYTDWLDMAVLSGELSLPRYELEPELYQDQVRWLPRGWSWVDPTKEIAAAKEAVRNGFATVSEIVAQTGADFEELVVQRQRELELEKEHGLMFDTNPEVNSSGKKAEESEEQNPGKEISPAKDKEETEALQG